MPQKRFLSAAGIAFDNSVIDSPEVLEAKIALGPMCGATFSKSDFFQSMRSLIASITRSQSFSHARFSS